MYQRATAPQSIGGVLDSGFKLFQACFKETFPLAVAAALVVAPFGLVGQSFVGEPPGPGLAIGFAIGVILLVCVALIFSAAIFARVDAVANNLELPLGPALSYGARCAPALFVASFLYGLAVMCGLILLISPGIIFGVWLIFAPQITVIERLGPFAALSRSRQLVRGHWWRTAALVTVIGIILGVLYVILGIVAGIVVALNPDEILATGALPWYVDLILNPLLSGVTTPLAYSLFVATFYDLKNRHEGGDIAERIAAATA